MGDFKKNPEKPFEVRVPNKIRKRIAMHEKHTPEPMGKKTKTPITSAVDIMKKRYKKRGSLWSRFIGKAKKFLE